MNASDYIRRYRAEEEEEMSAGASEDDPGCSGGMPARGSPVVEHFQDEVRKLDAFPLIPRCDVDSVWPQCGGFGDASPPFDGEGEASERVPELFDGASHQTPHSGMKSLRRLIEDGIKSDDLSSLEEVKDDPGFSGMLHRHAHEFSENVKDEHLCALLERAHRGCATVDLSRFCNLSLDKAVSIVKGLSKGQDQELRLTLPNLEDIG